VRVKDVGVEDLKRIGRQRMRNPGDVPDAVERIAAVQPSRAIEARDDRPGEHRGEDRADEHDADQFAAREVHRGRWRIGSHRIAGVARVTSIGFADRDPGEVSCIAASSSPRSGVVANLRRGTLEWRHADR
jgi:hypothetical protein